MSDEPEDQPTRLKIKRPVDPLPTDENPDDCDHYWQHIGNNRLRCKWCKSITFRDEED